METIPETLATLGTQETGSQNGQSRDTGNIGYTRHRTRRQYRDTGNIGTSRHRRQSRMYTIQRHWQHWVHKTQAQTNIGHKSEIQDTGNIGYTRMATETLTTLIHRHRSRDTGNIGHTGENRGNQDMTQSRDTGNIGYTRHRGTVGRMNNPETLDNIGYTETLATLDNQKHWTTLGQDT